MKTEENLRLVWSEFHSSTTYFLSHIAVNYDFSDVTLVCKDQQLVPGHRVILSAGSRFFESILKVSLGNPNPLVYLRGVSKDDLVSILSFLYTGETQVKKSRLQDFMMLARDLGVKGLSEEEEEEAARETGEEAAEVKVNLNTEEYNSRNKFTEEVNFTYGLAQGQTIIHPDSDEDRPTPSQQKRTKNPVWDYFIKDPENGERALCQILVGNQLCGVKCYAKNKTTSNMLRHMMTKHLATFTEMKEKIQSPIEETKDHSDVEDIDTIKSETLQNFKTIKPLIPQDLPEKSCKSPVWNNFSRDPDDLDRAICHLCGQALYAKNTTSTMLQHINNKHRAELDKVS